MDLLDQLRGMRDQAVALSADGGLCSSEVLESQSELILHAIGLILSTADDDLLRALSQISRASGDMEADTLLAEIERRGLDH